MNNDKNLLIAERYAESLIEFGKDGKLSYIAIATDLASVLTIISHSQDLYTTLTNPLISAQDKENIIDAVFEKDVDVLIKNFLKLLVEKNRFNLIYDIVNVYNTLLDDINGIVRVEVVSAIDLNDDEKNRIQDKLAEKLSKQISVKYNTNPAIIAGLQVKMGDDIIDMSVLHKLEEFKKTITK